MTVYTLTPLTTHRLSLRPVKHSDWHFVMNMQSDREQLKHIREQQNLEQIKEWFVDFARPFDGKEMTWAAMVAIDNHSHQPIGCFSIRIRCQHSANAELGYMIDRHYQGLGYACEGAKAVRDYLFNQLNVRRLTAFCNEDNIASWKVMESIGMQREGLMQQEYRINDTWHNTLIYGLVNPNFIAESVS
ncbi:GNAT family N-acetyltransferase [Thalassotalea maritima]|uniref:GNAT family N-acetyltransferase n=1 Tax=Thalassotalea maritima TaxID=3242416 RepID=UPI00352783E2